MASGKDTDVDLAPDHDRSDAVSNLSHHSDTRLIGETASIGRNNPIILEGDGTRATEDDDGFQPTTKTVITPMVQVKNNMYTRVFYV